MKKIFVLMSVLFFTAFTSNAQTDTEQNFHFGLKAAPALAWLTSDTEGFESSGTKLGFSYGLITEFNFATNYAFATGIDITYRGGNSKSIFSTTDTAGTVTTVTTETKYNLQYIELPLTLKLKTKEIGYLTYFLQFGVAPGMNIRSKADVEIATQIGSNTVTASDDNIDIKDDINVFMLSMIIGGGVEYTLSGSTHLLVGITFNNGFLDIVDGDDVKANSNYLALTVGVLF